MNYSNVATGRPINGGIEIVQFIGGNLSINFVHLNWDNLDKRSKRWLQLEIRAIKGCKYACLSGISQVFEYYSLGRINAWLDYAYSIYNVMVEDLPKPDKIQGKPKFIKKQKFLKIH